METLSVDVYSQQTNAAVLRAPNRRFPGVLVQGDTLAGLCDSANAVTRALLASPVEDDTRAEMQSLLADLVDLLLHYQSVLDQHGLQLPFERRSANDFATENAPRGDSTV